MDPFKSPFTRTISSFDPDSFFGRQINSEQSPDAEELSITPYGETRRDPFESTNRFSSYDTESHKFFRPKISNQ